MAILGIETSCDETSASIVNLEGEVLSNIILSQIKIHQVFGGVVPEVASRHHLETIGGTIDESLRAAGITFQDLKAIAVTNRPGLIGALLVGLSTAKALAYSLNIPLIPIHHLEAHLHAIFIPNQNSLHPQGSPLPKYPFIGLLVSGGHSALYKISDPGSYHLISQTRDDAAGEALDKAGKVLGLPYPGGVYMDREASKGDLKKYSFPRPLPQKSILDFSFSGLKTSLVEKIKRESLDVQKSRPDIAASYQEAVLSHLLEKTKLTLKKFKIQALVVSGGVAANSRLRQRFKSELEALGVKLWIPEMKYCTDNGAMIASLGLSRYKNMNSLDFDLNHLTTNAFASGEFCKTNDHL